MTDPTPTTPREPIDTAALSALAENLLDPAFRAAFKQDPLEAIQSLNIPTLPVDLLTHLAALTDAELALIAQETEFLKQFPVNCNWL